MIFSSCFTGYGKSGAHGLRMGKPKQKKLTIIGCFCLYVTKVIFFFSYSSINRILILFLLFIVLSTGGE